MAENYFNVHTRIKEKYEFTIINSCVVHTLNLLYVDAVECVSEVVAYVQFTQKKKSRL